MATACGISLGVSEDETEIFKRLAVEGNARPGGTLSLTLEYEQPYPVAVDVECVLVEVDPERTPTPESKPTATGTPAQPPTPTVVTIPRARPTPKNKVLDILTEKVPANPDGGAAGEATPVPGTIEGEFTAPERPGRYTVRCFTPQDDNNAISKGIVIAPGLTSGP